MKSNNIENQVFQFVKDRHWKFWKRLSEATKLEVDLGLTGDDAIEFMESFFKKFNVDGSKFKPSEYFHYEGFDSIGSSVFPVFGKKKHLPKYDITVGDLIKAIELGKWVDPNI